MAATPRKLIEPPDLPRVEKRPAGLSDHDYIERLRRDGPVALDRHGYFWTFSHDAMLACADPATTRQVETEKVLALGIASGPIHEYFANSLLFSNGETHRRRRRPLARAFAFPVMAALRPRIRAVAEGLIRPNFGRGEVDFLGEVAGRLPATIIAEILGAPNADIPEFSALVHAAMRVLSLRPAEAPADAGAALSELNAYVAGLLDARRRSRGDDFLSGFAADVAEAGLTEVEACVQIVSVILAGSDTTRIALCSTVSQLLRHPSQWTEFTADREGLKADVAAEGLRFDPVIGALPRVATADFALEGARIPKGAVLAPSVLAALRDPAIYSEPARFNIHRRDHPRYHPVFGAGAHRCLGEALARAELEESLAALATLAPAVTMAGRAPILRGVAGARGIDAMRLSFPSPPASIR
ncbi:cytochrome P450 [Pikeienuella piscinae]|uniref:Cytochrome P450 n=1 Tax=Pikeienuella piscinae TaxID=2748098 RepID=A0A7L5BTT7_9RHOB|nr:cytochrome P450 [Pikeienuella piscinae]QIE53978.1 cytochrome P450 [Pikeienuella piscinae]